MNLLKIVTIFNWAIVAFLAYLVTMETVFPTKGGDAAGRGMGIAIYYLAIAGLVVLIVLNLLPYSWAKYTAFGIVAVPFLLIQLDPVITKTKDFFRARREDAKPIFEDKERDQLARAFRDGEPEKFKTLLQTPIPRLHEGGEFLSYAIGEATVATYRQKEKIDCVRQLFEAGATLESTHSDDVPVHFSPAFSGNATLLRLLLEKGADANVVHKHFHYPILFEAINSYQEPEATIRVLLEYGANPNATAIFDDEVGPVSPLFRAAEQERWGICVALIEKGADPNFVSPKGTSIRDLVQQAEREYPAEGYSRQSDYLRLKSVWTEK